MKPTAIKISLVLLLFQGFISTIYAQTNKPINVVSTAVPFLRISPDARSAGMGDIGVATSPDASAGYWNAGKVAFNEAKAGISATYTPWLKDLVNDVYLASVAGYYKIADNQAIGGSLRYFSLGHIQFTDNLGAPIRDFSPKEFAIDVSLSRKLSSKNGVGITLKYINSNLAGGTTFGTTIYKAANAVAADLAYYHDGKKATGNGWAFGAVISNLGTKISYTNNADSKDFIPANLGLGTSYTKKYNSTNQLSFGLDINKLLVPTPPDVADAVAVAAYKKKSVVGSLFSSFGDAPGGFSEELKEFQISVGGEYLYNNQFALRAGYFYEDKRKGSRHYFTTGLGIKYNVFGFNFSYLLPSGSGVSRNPLSNTLRFSLLFDFGEDAGAKQ